MTDCFIYDAVRTPRGKGRKKDGALADAPPLRMAKTVLEALPERGHSSPKGPFGYWGYSFSGP